ncbi:MAG: hypothetical protein HUJ54_13525, partial [Erysipelotrichaceae bacterium]|nr:hypothetical protein [Erysipelotrichaceae bacterium]
MRLFTANQLKKRTASPRGGCGKKAFSDAFISSEYKEETGRERPEARTCKKTVRKLICIMLTLPLMTAAAGCASKPKLESRFIQTNHTISPNSQWFASFIHQGIDSSLQVQAKDDFFTFANRNWLLNTQIAKADQQTGTVADGQKQVDQKIESIVRGQVEVNGGTRPAGLSEEQAEHDRDLVTKLAALAGNWDQRNKMGAEPLRPYLEAIENITTLEDLDHYLTSRDVKKIGPFSLMSVSVDPTVMDKTTNAVCLKRPNDQQSAALCRLTLPGYSNYMSMARMDLKAVTKARQAMRSVLGRLGYTADDIEKRVAQAFDLETELAEIYRNAEDFSILGDQERQKATENGFTLDELKDLAGRYPLAEFLEACGMGSTDRYNVDFPEAVPMIGRLYSPANLEKLKSYLILQTVLQAASLLDRDLYDTAAVLADPTDHDTPVNESNWDDETNILISGFIDKYLADPLNQVFIWQNCTEENKAMVRSLAEEIRDEYKDMLAREDWLSEETRQKAIEKLDCMAIRSLYPDTFADYTGLSLDKA